MIHKTKPLIPSRSDGLFMKKNYVLDKFFRGISSQQQVAGSKLQVSTFMKRKCEPLPNFTTNVPQNRREEFDIGSKANSVKTGSFRK
jgi:hypothetical protein